MSIFNEFTRQYKLSKTLRFELIPQGNTLENMQEHLAEDLKRKESSKIAKKILDEFHKRVIEEGLKGISFDEEIEEYIHLTASKRLDDREKLEDKLRKKITDKISQDNIYWDEWGDKAKLFKKGEVLYRICQNLSQEELKKIGVSSAAEASKVISEFENFTTYFGGFHDNRKNMYSNEKKSTAIGYRLIHENLPKYLDNCKVFDEIYSIDEMGRGIKKLEEEYGPLSYFFNPKEYGEFLTQERINKYNLVLGGYSTKDGKKEKGLNEYINEYNQKQSDRKNKISKMKILFKQILSDKESMSFVVESFLEPKDVVESMRAYFLNDLSEKVLFKVSDREAIVNLFGNIENYDLDTVYIDSKKMTDISNEIYSDYRKFKEMWLGYYDENNGKFADTKKYREDREKAFKNAKNYSIAELIKILKLNANDNDLIDYLKSKPAELVKEISENYEKIESIEVLDNFSLKDIELIKLFLESIKKLQAFCNFFTSRAETNSIFYSDFYAMNEKVQLIDVLYNKTRNYLTKKPYSTEKIKLNFGKSTFLSGWSKNKESANLGVLMEKDGNFYLAVINNTKFKFKECNHTSEETYNKFNYNAISGACKMLPKVFFSKKLTSVCCPSDEIKEIKADESYKKTSPNFSIQRCRMLIDYYKKSINGYTDWDVYNFNFSDTAMYNDITDFFSEFDKQAYQISRVPVLKSNVDEAVEVGDIYMFQIYNKDFSKYSKGKENLHTIYWRLIFDEENLKDVVYKLNGGAEVFYRKASIKDESKIIHKAKEPIGNKNELNKKKESVFDYDLIKDRRYTVDKLQFHVPITINPNSGDRSQLNNKVGAVLRENEGIHVIGIDRGERHLLYISVINQRGEIVEQVSLNTIVNEYDGVKHEINYHDLLQKKEKERDSAKKNWKTIENIKELKQGYLSQAVNKIVKLMIKYNAIVSLEDLNSGFKNSRIKVEKQVYQNFEKMLINKLNFYVNKEEANNQNSGALKGYQLTEKFESFQKMSKQNGFLFYIPAWNTSKIDPTTGFVNFFYTKYENVEKTKKFFSNFNWIKYNVNCEYFEFEANYKKFTDKDFGEKETWIICAHSDRISTFRNPKKNQQWDNKKINLNEEYVRLLKNHSIDFENGKDLRDAFDLIDDTSFWKNLFYLFKLTVQMRNSITNSEVDYLISPVKNNDGYFYDSRKSCVGLPDNADANGAYNIALKGLWVVDRLKEMDDVKKLKFSISNKEWLSYVQKKCGMNE